MHIIIFKNKFYSNEKLIKKLVVLYYWSIRYDALIDNKSLIKENFVIKLKIMNLKVSKFLVENEELMNFQYGSFNVFIMNFYN